uniref:hypothetical protein n=1 Tax=Agathobacter sp. TaxID=2021311 RepID=UPI004056CA3C
MIALIIATMMTTLAGCGTTADNVIDNTEVTEAVTEIATEMTEVIDEIADATEDIVDATEVVADADDEDEVANDDVAEEPANDQSDKTDKDKANNIADKTPADNKDKSDDKPAENAEKTPAKDDKKPDENKTEDKKPAEQPVHKHNYTGKVTKNATCAAKGVKTYTCNCGATYTEDIAKTDYKYDNGTVTKAATCNAEGTKTYKCACGKTYNESIPKTAHQYDNGTVTKAPSCTEDGVMTYKCKTCGATYTEGIGMGSHTYAHHDAKGHEEQVLVKEAWDETVTEVHAICIGCGYDGGAGNAGTDNVGYHIAQQIVADFNTDCQSYTSKKVTVSSKHHDAVYETRWVVDSEAYDECTTCGHKK